MTLCSVPKTKTGRSPAVQECGRVELQPARQRQFPDHRDQEVARVNRRRPANRRTRKRRATGSSSPMRSAITGCATAKVVYQYRPDLKQLVEHPIPPQLQGQAIVDGPLPFLFGADAAKLKQRYWMKLDQAAEPGSQPDLDHRAAEVPGPGRRLYGSRRDSGSPSSYCRSTCRCGCRTVAITRISFDIKNATKNNPLARIQASVSAAQRAVRLEARRRKSAAAASGRAEASAAVIHG